jgi:hypothetical protein
MIQPATPAPPTHPPDAPDWDQVREEVHCPLCGYNLRGLVDPRCPECGYAFRWSALLDPAERLHPYLFEHHPERNVRSFLRTMTGGLRPGRFWSGLQPAQPSRPRRLLVYWLIVAALPFVALLAHAGTSFWQTARANQRQRAAAVPFVQAQLKGSNPYQKQLARDVAVAGGTQQWIDQAIPPTGSRRFFDRWSEYYELPMTLGVPLLFAAWPWLTFATLLIFAASMRRAKVRVSHVVRCVVYCGDFSAWLVPLVLVAYVLAEKYSSRLSRELPSARSFVILAAVALPLYNAYRLTKAYRLYLRFDHPRSTAASAQFIVWLVFVIVLLNLPGS